MNDMTYEEYQRFASAIGPSSEGCPLSALLATVQGKWTLRVLFELSKRDQMRFGELKRQIPAATNTVLTATLRSLEEGGLVTRTQFNEIPPHVEYSLTEAGKDMYPVFIALLDWAEKHVVR